MTALRVLVNQTGVPLVVHSNELCVLQGNRSALHVFSAPADFTRRRLNPAAGQREMLLLKRLHQQVVTGSIEAGFKLDEQMQPL